MLCSFLLYSKVNHPYVRKYPLSSRLHSHINHYRAQNSVLCAIQQVLINYPLVYIQQCVYVNLSLPIYPFPLCHKFFSTSVTQYLLYQYHLYQFFRSHIQMIQYDICLSLSNLLHSVWQSLDPSMLLKMALFCSFFMDEWLNIRNLPADAGDWS